MLIKKFCALLLSVSTIFALSACTPKVGGSDYSTVGAQQSYSVEFGTVHSVRMVRINDGETRTAIGAVGGGVLGGVIGNMFGGGRGNTLATIGGAIAGAAAGGAAGQATGNQEGVEVTVNMDSGRTVVIVQGADLTFSAGQRVRVTEGDGKTRVSPM